MGPLIDESSTLTSPEAMTSNNDEDSSNGESFLTPSPPRKKIRSEGKENAAGCQRKEDQVAVKTPNDKKESPGTNVLDFHGGIVYKLHRRQIPMKVNLSNTIETHVRIAEGFFHRMVPNLSSDMAISSIDFIEHFRLEEEFLEQKYILEYEGVDAEERFMFLDVKVQNLPALMWRNVLPILKHKKVKHGFGFYFSDVPNLSYGLEDGLVLCRVLPGHTQNENSKVLLSCYDSLWYKKSIYVKGKLQQCNGLVVNNSTHILPYCIIRLKSKSAEDLSLAATKTYCQRNLFPTAIGNRVDSPVPKRKKRPSDRRNSFSSADRSKSISNSLRMFFKRHVALDFESQQSEEIKTKNEGDDKAKTNSS